MRRERMSDLLTNLNPEQRAAVELTERPVFVLAGPGTGKTRVTCNKLAYLIKEQGYQPDEILALTFSGKAAQEMEDRVEELLPKVADIQISTFHSFCYSIIRENSLELGINTGGPVITDEYQQAFLLGHLDELGLEHFMVPARPIDLVKTFQGAIARFKQENIPIERLEAYLKKKLEEEEEPGEELLKLTDFAKAYRAYEDFKAEKNLLDFGDMQLLTLKLFETKPVILERYQQKLRYIIVDEFQDTDFIQLQILFKLAPTGNITVVGDDDQSIYRFRGAYLTNILELREFYGAQKIPPEIVVLKTNYRCTGNIQKVASNLIRNNPDRVEKDIITQKDDGAQVHSTLYQNDWEQAKGIARIIHDLHEQGRGWGDMAILVRKRTFAIPLIEMFEKTGIPLEIVGSREYFREPIVRAVVAYLKVLNDPILHQPALGHLLMRPVHGILPGEIPKLATYARNKRVSLWETLGDLNDFKGDSTQFMQFHWGMKNLFALKGERGLLELVRAVLFGKDLFRVEIARGHMDNIRLLNRFLHLTTEFLEIYPDASLEDFLVHLEALTDLGMEDKATEPTKGTVHLMTVHGSKGKEFPVVFIPCLNQDRFPSRYRPYKIDIPDELADGLVPEGGAKELHRQEERRLFYVATTRGKDELFLSYCKNYGSNKKETPPSVFHTEIMDAGVGYEHTEKDELEEELEERSRSVKSAIFNRMITAIQRDEWQEAVDALTALAMVKDEGVSILKSSGNLQLQAYIDELKVLQRAPVTEHLKDITYSPSKLGLYENCPKKYWFSYVLKIPGERKTYFTLGSVVHTVIELITQQLKAGEVLSEDEALTILESRWRSGAYEFTSKEQQDRAVAEEMIRNFLVHQGTKDSTIVDIEKWISLDIEGRTIRGKVDRIDDVGETLEVIDYKSSKNRTSRPQLKKDFQMALYKLGVDNAFQKPVSQVGHWYLRMDQEWMVELTDEELEAVRQRAVAVMESIEAGQFEATPGYQSCRYCDYGELCDEKEK